MVRKMCPLSKGWKVKSRQYMEHAMKTGGEQWIKLAFPRKGPLSFGTRDERVREAGSARTIVGKGLERDD